MSYYVLSYSLRYILLLIVLNNTLSTRPSFYRLKNAALVSVAGEGRLKFLHGLGTNSFEDAIEGSVLSNCFLNAQAKLLYHSDCYVTQDTVNFICEDNSANKLAQHFNKFIFPADKVNVQLYDSVSMIYTTGVDIDKTLFQNTFPDVSLADIKKTGDILSFTSDSTSLQLIPVTRGYKKDYIAITNNNIPMKQSNNYLHELSDKEWELFTISTCKPKYGSEINDKYTPLEAGLMSSIHFNKGCFVGNEIISKTVQTNAVRQRLVFFTIIPTDNLMNEVFDLSKASIINEESELIGKVTRVEQNKDDMWFGIGYIKTKYSLLNQTATYKLCMNNESSNLLPYQLILPLADKDDNARFDTASSPSPPVKKVASKGKEILVGLEGIMPPTKGSTSTADDARKAAKLKAMAQRVADLQAKKTPGEVVK